MGLTMPPGLVRRDELTADEVRRWDDDLEGLCASMDDVFVRPASRQNLRDMVRGLLSDVPRKNMWQVAEAAGHPTPDRLQDFLARATWDADELRDRVREFVVDSLRAGDAVLIADETGDIKKGVKSVGVARQYTGVTGQVENAQVSVHLSYGSARGRAIIDRELYLGLHWAGTGGEHEERCRAAGVPGERARQVVTKPELARRMLERALDASVSFSWFLADELYGTSRS
ncbi:IS701 family transposase [Streptomyces sp. NPDC001774]